MTLPLNQPVQVNAGDVIEVSFHYRAGGSIPSLEAAIRVDVVTGMATDSAKRIATYA